MKKWIIFFGVILVFLAAAMFVYFLEYYLPARKALALLEKGKIYFEQENQEMLRQAIEQFTTILSEYPESPAAPEALFLLAESYERMSLRDVAFGKYKKLLEQKIPPELLEKVRFKIAKLQILRAYTDEGKSQLLLLLNTTTDPKLRSEIYTEIGRIYAKAGKLNEAQKNYQIALREYPENREAKILLAKSLGEQNKTDEAFGIYEDYLTFQAPLDSDKKQVVQDFRKEALEKGLKFLQEQNIKEAIKLLQFVSEKFPNTNEAEDALYFLGNAYLQEKDYVKALKAFNDAVSNSPRHRDEASFLKKGETYYYRKDYKKAAALFRYVQNNYPKGKYYQIAKDWEEEALRALTEESDLTQEKEEVVDEKIEVPSEAPVLEDSKKTPKTELIEQSAAKMPKLEDGTVTP